jgi:hypothetical protein
MRTSPLRGRRCRRPRRPRGANCAPPSRGRRCRRPQRPRGKIHAPPRGEVTAAGHEGRATPCELPPSRRSRCRKPRRPSGARRASLKGPSSMSCPLSGNPLPLAVQAERRSARVPPRRGEAAASSTEAVTARRGGRAAHRTRSLLAEATALLAVLEVARSAPPCSYSVGIVEVARKALHLGSTSVRCRCRPP